MGGGRVLEGHAPHAEAHDAPRVRRSRLECALLLEGRQLRRARAKLEQPLDVLDVLTPTKDLAKRVAAWLVDRLQASAGRSLANRGDPGPGGDASRILQDALRRVRSESDRVAELRRHTDDGVVGHLDGRAVDGLRGRVGPNEVADGVLGAVSGFFGAQGAVEPASLERLDSTYDRDAPYLTKHGNGFTLSFFSLRFRTDFSNVFQRF